jgi:glycerol-3-phosphate dehydrogenase
MLQEIKETFPGRPDFSDAICSQQIGVLPCSADDLVAPDPQPIPAPVVLRGEQLEGPVGLWIVQGEKWTTARYMADRVVTEMAARHNFPIRPSASTDTVLVEKDCPGLADADEGESGHAKKRLELRRGLAAAEIFRKAMSHPEASRVVSGRTDVYRSEVEFALANEDIVKLSDLARRLGIGQLARLSEKSLTDLVEMAAKVKNWDETEQRLQLEDYTLDPRWS